MNKTVLKYAMLRLIKEAHEEPSQTSVTAFFAKIGNGF